MCLIVPEAERPEEQFRRLSQDGQLSGSMTTMPHACDSQRLDDDTLRLGADSVSEATDYYNTRFGPQLIEVANADSGWRNRISLVGLIPGAQNATPGQARSFSSLSENDRLLFLMCFFYSALLDQAIHSSLREEHSGFDHLARYPKLVGILGSAHTNLHPANLLVAITVHRQGLSSEAVQAWFDDLTRFMIKEYVRFFTVEYPSLTTHLQSPESQRQAILSVCQEVVRATAPPEPDIWRHVFTLGHNPPDWPLAESLIRICSQVFSDKLAAALTGQTHATRRRSNQPSHYGNRPL